MMMIRNGNVALSNLSNRYVAMSVLRRCHVHCHMRPPLGNGHTNLVRAVASLERYHAVE